ncbi:MAG: monovalent cation/H(+) antiporter subunit G [Desulfurococcaceae archaeon]
MHSIVVQIIQIIGLALISLGGLASLISSIGFHRFKNFYLRLHALTISTIWGCVYPLIGVSLYSLTIIDLGIYRYFIAGASLITALIVLFLAPAGSHAIARAVHRSKIIRVKPCIADLLNEDLCG